MTAPLGGRRVPVVPHYVLDGPRPYLHPIRTLAGVVVSDAEPEDHPWHLGLSLAVQDVNGTNLWGGRTYVRGEGYVWRDDHGRIAHVRFEEETPSRLVEWLVWLSHQGEVLLTERRVITAEPVDDRSWQLSVAWELTAMDRVVMGSPTTNGREYGAGYGGCFLRLAPGEARVTAGDLEGEEKVNGCDLPSVTWQAKTFSVTMEGAQRWFVRTGIYPGICAAWAFDEVRVIEAGQMWPGRVTLTISDR